MVKNICAAIATSCKLTNNESKLLIILTDHVWDDDIFIESVNRGLYLVNDGLWCLGIKPSYAENGYGYLNYSGDNLIKIVEKPNNENAEEYLKSGNYLWNSGNFLFSNKMMTSELISHANDIYESVSKTLDNSGDLSKDEIKLNK